MPGPINKDIQTQKAVEAQRAAQQAAQQNTQSDAPLVPDKKEIQAIVDSTCRSTFQRGDSGSALRQQEKSGSGGRPHGCALPGS